MAGPPSTGAATVQELAAPAADLLVAAMGDEGEGDLVAPRFARGCRAFAACRDGRLVGYGWLSSGPEWIGEVGVELRPAAGEAYVWNCVTLPRHRRQGVFGALLTAVVAQARTEGLKRLWIASVPGGAEGVVLGAGFRPILAVESHRVGPLRWFTARPAGGGGPEALAAAQAALGLWGPALRRARRRRH